MIDIYNIEGANCTWVIAHSKQLPDTVEIHQTAHSSGPKAIKSFVLELEDILDVLRTKGIKQVLAPGGRDDPKLFKKYLAIMGADEIYDLQIDTHPDPVMGRKVL